MPVHIDRDAVVVGEDGGGQDASPLQRGPPDGGLTLRCGRRHPFRNAIALVISSIALSRSTIGMMS